MLLDRSQRTNHLAVLAHGWFRTHARTMHQVIRHSVHTNDPETPQAYRAEQEGSRTSPLDIWVLKYMNITKRDVVRLFGNLVLEAVEVG